MAEKNYPSLMAAVAANDYGAAKAFIDCGGDVNQRDDTMLTPYLCAGANGFSEILALTIENGADVKSTNRFGGTALLPSAEKGYLRNVQLCLQHGVEVNHANDLGWTALHEAVFLGNGGLLYQDIVRALMENGADPFIKDRQGRDAFMMAKEKGQEQVLAILEGTPADGFASRMHQLLWAGNALAAYEAVCQETEKQPEDRRFHYYKGYCLCLLKEYEAAIEVYRGQDCREFDFYIAQAYRLMGAEHQAVEAFNRGAAEERDRDFFLYHKSNYMRELGRHGEAIEIMDLLLSKEPGRADFWFHKANSLRSLQKHKEAADAMAYAIQADPQNPLYHNHRQKSLGFMADKA